MPRRKRDKSSDSSTSDSDDSYNERRVRRRRHKDAKRRLRSKSRMRSHSSRKSQKNKKSNRSKRIRESRSPSVIPSAVDLSESTLDNSSPPQAPGVVTGSVTPVINAEEGTRNVSEESRASGSSVVDDGQGKTTPGSSGGMLNNFLNMNVPMNIQDLLSFISSCVKPDHSIKYNHDKNIIPEFDPSIQNHRIDNWLVKVNECAQIYGWSDQQTAHFALPRLVGHAKKWYEGLKTIKNTWLEWQEHLKRAFPTDTNYGALLNEMLGKKYSVGDSVDEYYYNKMILLNACDISGKKAVDCIIYGLEDRTIRAGASSARFAQPEDLLKYLKDMCREQRDVVPKLNKYKSSLPNTSTLICNNCNMKGHRASQCRKSTNGSEMLCFNCKETGHRVFQCPKPVIKCEHCQRYGHKSDDCFSKKKGNQTDNKKENQNKRVMLTATSKTKTLQNKYYKNAFIDNGNSPINCFIDFGSECTLISDSIAYQYNLTISTNCLPVISGVGEARITVLGETRLLLSIDGVEALITTYVVPSEQLHVPMLVGQNFTELPHIIVIKTDSALEILKRNVFCNTILPDIEHETGDVIKLFAESNFSCTDVGLIKCYTTTDEDSIIFVPGSYRVYQNCQYWIKEGVYKIMDKSCEISLVVLSNKMLQIKKDTLVVRGNKVQYNKNIEKLNCLHIQTHCNPIDTNDININPELSLKETETVKKLITKYRKTFAQNLSELGCTTISEMEIKLSNSTPVVYRPYRLSYKERQLVHEMVKELLQNDIIEESSSSYASPIILVSKKTGGHRLCIDYRTLNSRTVKDHFPLPLIDDQLDQLSGSKYYTTLDLMSGYYQVPIREECRHVTAFVTPDGLYQFKRMPFGLANAPSVFQRTMARALSLNRAHESSDSKGKPALAYMDDLIIHSKDFEQGVQKLEATFNLLNEANLTLNVKKCYFFQTSIDYLGYEITSEGIKPGKVKIEAVRNFPVPRTVHEVRQFIGLASYFRKFIDKFSIIARPLTDLTRKSCPWRWEDEQVVAFENLKSKLIERPLLTLYSPNYITELHTDASKMGLAGILLQKENDQASLKPVAYFSRKTTIDEQKFHAYDLETLAVVASLHRFRVYLLGLKFTIMTDCNALRSTFSKRDLLPRIARWWLALQEYDCDIVYRPNHSMTHVDALSRNPIDINDFNSEVDFRVLNITQDDWLLSVQLSDPKLCFIKEILNDPKYKDVTDIKQNFVMKDNRLFRRVMDELKWVVPKGARWQICKQNHDDIGHFSVDKTFSKISKDFWFPKMKRFITKYVKACIHCAYGKMPAGKKEGFLHSIPKNDIPFETVHIDHLGPFVKSSKGNVYLLVLVDAFTKFCIIKPLRTLKSSPTIRALEEIFTTFGYPKRLISDRGTSFTSDEFHRFCEKHHIRHILNAVASPRANGQVERYNRTILGSLSTYTDKLGETKWDTELGNIQWGLNNTLNKGTGKTPAEALFGRNLTHSSENVMNEIFEDTRPIDNNIEEIRADVSQHISQDQHKQKDRFDRTRKGARKYAIGDLVKIQKQVGHNEGKSKKLVPVYSGPYRVSKVLDNDRYEVSSIPGSSIGKKHYCNVWAVDQIQPWISTSINEPSTESESDEELSG